MKVFKEAELREIAEAFYQRLAAAGCQTRQSVAVVNHLLALLTESVVATKERTH